MGAADSSSKMKFVAVCVAVLTLYSLSDAISVTDLVSQLREACESRGCSNHRGVGKRFKISDNDRDWSLSLDEFTLGMRNFNLPGATDADFQTLFEEFNTNGSGMDYDEFLKIFLDE